MAKKYRYDIKIDKGFYWGSTLTNPSRELDVSIEGLWKAKPKNV